MVNILRYFLFPFSLIYGFIILIRNKFYDWGIFKSTSFDLPVICIGNLVVGGAGKTPTTEYLVKLLSAYKVAILSRGYGRQTKGLILADETATVTSIGDEPMQYYRKFPQVTVVVCEDRVKGINFLKDNHEVIILDDAYQHRAVKAGFNLLLFDFNQALKRQFLLPTGNLREPLANYNRAQAVLITKSPTRVNMVDQIEIRRKIDLDIDKRISFSSIAYGQLTPVFAHVRKEDFYENGEILELGSLAQSPAPVVFLLTGIANPKPLIDYLKPIFTSINHFEYPDHHSFNENDIRKLIEAFQAHPAKEKIIITTEKDSQRLLTDNLKDLLLNLPIFYLPIEIALAPKDKVIFDQNILNYVANHKRIG